MKRKGMGKIQTATKLANRQNIIKVLIDNKWHSYKEIREKANISNVTLSGHLKEMKPLLDKKRDASSNRLSALYKIKPLFALELARGIFVEVSWKEIEEQMLKTKDLDSALKLVLESINTITNTFLLTIMSGLASNKDLREDSETVYLILETFVWENYRTLTWNLVESSINNFMGEKG